MKRNEWMALIATTILMFAVCLSASAKDVKSVERGMTKQEVINILGKPKLTSFDAYGDKWEFIKNTKQITVSFDLNGRVVACNTNYVVDVNTNHTVDANHQRHTPPYAIYPNAPMYYDCCLDETSFAKLYNKVKNASFDDNKFDLLEVASLGCFYSCNQVARMMSIFTFGDKQLKVLSMMASHIVDPQNTIAIYNVLTFDSEKAKAGEILKNSRKHK